MNLPAIQSMKNEDEGAVFERRIQLERLIAHHDAEGDSPLKIGDEPFRWSTVQTLADSVLASHYDLNVAMWLLRAQVIQNGLNGLREGLLKVAELVRKPSTELHPQVDEEDESPAQAHALVLGWLGGENFLSLIRAMPIDSDYAPRIADLLRSAAAVAVIPGARKSVACRMLEDSRTLLVEIRENISVAGGQWNRDPVVAIELISECHRLLSGVSIATDASEGDSKSQPEKSLANVGVSDASPRNRAEVKFLLDRLDRYYNEIEPAHPAPLLIGRLKKMVDASFEEILKELYVDAPLLISRISNPVGHI